MRSLALGFLLALPILAQPVPPFPEPVEVEADGLEYRGVVDYDIEVRLDVVEKKLVGRQIVSYTNDSPDIIPDLRFHTYLQASANLRSTYYREKVLVGGRLPRSEEEFGYMHITRAVINGIDLIDDAEHVLAEDAAPDDQTVWRLPLRAPLFPGQTVTVEMDFVAKLPRQWDRVGYQDDFYMAVQWFPKLGVWESKGERGARRAGWNCHAFHYFSEFYASFGSYRVAITAPDDYIVGGTGVRTSRNETVEGVRHVFEQDRVHDFAWTASPDFVVVEETFQPDDHIAQEEAGAVAQAHGLTVEDVLPQPVRVILLIQPQHAHQARRHLDAAFTALKHYGLAYGPYPYETLTMVDTPRFAGGMEYPTLITLGTRYINPEGDLDLEDLIVHEFGHQYWYGLVGTNEFEESWLDEGFNTYTTARVLDRAWGPSYPHDSRLGLPRALWKLLMPNLPDWDELLMVRRYDRERTRPRIRASIAGYLGIAPTSQLEKIRWGALADWDDDVLRKDSWDYLGYAYWNNSYGKAGTILLQLEHEVGTETMARIMRRWLETYAYRHPDTDDFIRLVEEEVGRPMGWFFSELMERRGYLDYRVGDISARVIDETIGYDDGLVFDPGGVEETYSQLVELHNDGTLRYPVDVDIHFADGTVERRRWDGLEHHHALRVDNAAEITRVVIDPDDKLIIDRNEANDSYAVEPDPGPARRLSTRLLFAVQNILQSLAGGL